MFKTEKQWATSITRRKALAALGGMLAGSPILHAQLDPRHYKDHRRVPGLSEMVDIFDFEPICFQNVPRHLYDYMARSTDSEWTIRRNRHAFEWVDLIERPGVTAEQVDTSTEVLGIKMTAPIIVAPSSNHGHMHPEGEIGTYKGTTAVGMLMAVASGPSIALEKIAAAADGPRWNQFYPIRDLAQSGKMLERFQNNGARAIVLTVDQQAAVYERALHNRWLGGNLAAGESMGRTARPTEPTTGPARYGVETRRLWYSWDFMEQLRQYIKGPTIIKGILTAEDAKICVERGFDGLIISNHGARSLDYAPSTLEVLPEIVEAVNGKIAVLIDSGFRRGSDVFKALALGADAVLVGRAQRWGLGAFGAPGVQRVLEILQTELRDSMVKTGRKTIADIDRTTVRTDFS